MESKYHIDVTEEEDQLFRDQSEPASNKQRIPGNKLTWTIVAGIHIGVVGAFLGLPSLLANNPSPAQTEAPKKPQISQNLPSSEAPMDSAPAKLPALPVKSSTEKLTASYTVKQGDTIYSIARKFKLNVDALIKLNQLKDPNKIVPGQTLKFL